MPAAELQRWRQAERERLIAARLALPAAERQRLADAIAAALDAELGDLAGRTVAVYWPIRGEPNLRPWMAGLAARGATCALPLVAVAASPLVFRAWRAGDAMARGVWNIPEPAAGPAVTPDIVIAPVVGFDAARYRLGYGGGYYDRTLAALAAQRRRPARVVGVGCAQACIATIHPQPHDIAMDVIVTESGVTMPPAGGALRAAD